MTETIQFLGKTLNLEIQTNAWKNRAAASGDTLYEPSHNARFKTYLDGQMPRWREIQERMRVS